MKNLSRVFLSLFLVLIMLFGTISFVSAEGAFFPQTGQLFTILLGIFTTNSVQGY